ncbi:MAG: FAD-binding oxidoreductase [Micavibrio sp.]|nr:FAD-binding oxidoreductase [Micavibrio sp.]
MINRDIIIFGGGIAGLWALRRLVDTGYDAVLIEKDKLGGDQTLASQGMIHGGQKYAITGQVNDHARSIAAMPERWERCLNGSGDIDLSATKILSPSQIMWPAGGMLSDMAVFAAAKLVQDDTVKLERAAWPEILKGHPHFKGSVYLMKEEVLDSKSLLAALAAPVRSRIYKGSVSTLDQDGSVTVDNVTIRAKAIFFCAGQGNEDALRFLDINDRKTQRRPLKQVMVSSVPFPLYAHGIVGNPKPRMTITSHPGADGGFVWYLGGDIAEKGVGLSDDEQMAFACRELQDLFPQIDWAAKDYAVWSGDRAEPFSDKGALPPGPYLHSIGNISLGWPAKLTFAPGFGDLVMERVKDLSITPTTSGEALPLPHAEIGQYPWEKATWKKLNNARSA